MTEIALFVAGCFCGGVAVADWLGLKLARHGDPFWIGWSELRSWGLWKSNR